MDPDIYAELEDLSGDRARAGDNGTSYLRRLKMQADQHGLPGAPSKLEPATPAAERRHSRRYECAGSVELRIDGGGLRMRGALKDISLHGCYLEMPTTFTVDTKVWLTLDVEGVRVLTEATVRASYPALGMGMCFAQMAATQELRLKEILTRLAENRAILTPRWRSI